MTELKARFLQLLRWSEKYTKTDMVYLAAGGFWMTVAQAVSSLSALLLAIAFANLLPQETYGTYKYILSIAGLFAVFTLPGIDTAYARAAAKGDVSTYRASTATRLKGSALGAIFALLGSAYYWFVGGNVNLSIALLVIAATLPFFDTFALYSSYLSGRGRFDLMAKYHALTQVVSIGALVTTATLTDSLTALLVAYFVPLIVVRAALYVHTFRSVPNERDAEKDKETVTYGWHLTLMNILGIVAGNIDKILIWHFLGPVPVAIYTFAVAIPEQLKGPLKGVSDLAFRKFATQTADEIRNGLPSLWRKMGLYALALLAVSLAYVLVAPYIFQILFPQYMESVLYSQVFMLSAVGLVGTIPLAIIGAHRKIKEQYVFFTSQPALQIVLYFLMIPTFGIMGAIVARFIMRVLYAGQSVIMLTNSFKKEPTV